ncbi:hypothetical protein FJTKL_06231 [Diaporthe vaccinii]|uniref:Uncharacterized protein n=1 Tax=Diaporthe vaccinii TaxID=105482 RepID=A0ABR4DQK7_9PEZI
MALVLLLAIITFPLAVWEISGICHVDADFNENNEEVEDVMKLQCLCTNKSFDVGGATALCASCIDQKGLASDKDDNMDDINEIMARCGFKSMVWTPEAAETAPAVANVTVSASRLMASSQLTTSIDFAPRPTAVNCSRQQG